MNVEKVKIDRGLIQLLVQKNEGCFNDKPIIQIEFGFSIPFAVEQFKKIVNGGTICADSTFGITKQGYSYTTFVIIDGRQCGVPFLNFINTSESKENLVPL